MQHKRYLKAIIDGIQKRVGREMQEKSNLSSRSGIGEVDNSARRRDRYPWPSTADSRTDENGHETGDLLQYRARREDAQKLTKGERSLQRSDTRGATCWKTHEEDGSETREINISQLGSDNIIEAEYAAADLMTGGLNPRPEEAGQNGRSTE